MSNPLGFSSGLFLPLMVASFTNALRLFFYSLFLLKCMSSHKVLFFFFLILLVIFVKIGYDRPPFQVTQFQFLVVGDLPCRPQAYLPLNSWLVRHYASPEIYEKSSTDSFPVVITPSWGFSKAFLSHSYFPGSSLCSHIEGYSRRLALVSLRYRSPGPSANPHSRPPSFALQQSPEYNKCLRVRPSAPSPPLPGPSFHLPNFPSFLLPLNPEHLG